MVVVHLRRVVLEVDSYAHEREPVPGELPHRLLHVACRLAGRSVADDEEETFLASPRPDPCRSLADGPGVDVAPVSLDASEGVAVGPRTTLPVGVQLDERAVLGRVAVDVQVDVADRGQCLVQKYGRVPRRLDLLPIHRSALVHKDAYGHPVGPCRPLLTVDILHSLHGFCQLAGIEKAAAQAPQVTHPVGAVASEDRAEGGDIASHP